MSVAPELTLEFSRRMKPIRKPIAFIWPCCFWSWELKDSHWGNRTCEEATNEMAAIMQTTYSNASNRVKIFEFRLKFHWILFLRVQLTMKWRNVNMHLHFVSSSDINIPLVRSLQWRAMASCSGADQRKHQSASSLAFVRGILWIPLTKGQQCGKCFLWWCHHVHSDGKQEHPHFL